MPTGIYKRKKRVPMTQEQKDKISRSKKENPTKYWLGKKRDGKPWKGKKATEETKKKQSEAKKGFIPWNKGLKGYRSGEKSHLWKGGVTPINEKIRKSLEYKLWRKSVFARDNYTCVWCFSQNGNGKEIILNADHIKPFALFPELRFAIDNGRTLCIDCHKKTDTYGEKCKKLKNN